MILEGDDLEAAAELAKSFLMAYYEGDPVAATQLLGQLGTHLNAERAKEETADVHR